MTALRQMKKLLDTNTGSGRRQIRDVFRDFCELTALSLRNSVDREGWDDREAKYLEVASRYNHDEMRRFPDVLAELIDELGRGHDDVLGKLYMSLELGNSGLGQFFTPFEVSLVMAKMTVGSLMEQLQEHATIRLHEPACGSGGMIVATAKALLDEGLNPQQLLRVSATDVDLTAVHMTYVHMSLLHIPADVVHGNTLTQEVHDVWRTPALFLAEGPRRASAADERTAA